MSEKVVPPFKQVRNIHEWQNAAAKFVLLIFGIALWTKWSSLGTGILVTLIWIFDDGLRRIDQIIREPLVLGILLLALYWRWDCCGANTRKQGD